MLRSFGATLGNRQVVRHRPLEATFGGSNPSSPAIFVKSMKKIFKNVLITGGSGGIGSELVKRLVADGAKVFVFDKVSPKEPLAGVEYVEVDVTKGIEVEVAVKKVESRLGEGGKLGLLVNNAGVMRRGNLFDTSEQDYDFVMDINLKGMWLVLKYAKPLLADDATVFLMSSRHGMTVKPDPAIYCLSKHGVWGLAEILKKTCPGYAVKVAYPGSVDTPLTWVQVKDEDVDAKKKTVVTPEFIAEKIMELITGQAEKLVFDEETKEYSFE